MLIKFGYKFEIVGWVLDILAATLVAAGGIIGPQFGKAMVLPAVALLVIGTGTLLIGYLVVAFKIYLKNKKV